MKSQRGVAAVTAILIVAVAAAAATVMLSQQSAMLDQVSMVTARAQADAYAQAGIDWARGVLAAHVGSVDSLDEPWAQPIAALPVERAVVSGALVDEQGKMDLNNLATGGGESPQALAFRRLLAQLGLPPDLADPVRDWVDADQEPSPAGAEDAYYLSLPRPYRAANQPMTQVEELYRVRGFDAATVGKLLPYVTALPHVLANDAKTAINVNTAPAAVIAAALDVPPGKVAGLVAARRKKAFASKQAFLDAAVAAGAKNPVEALFDVRSAFFTVRIAVAQDDVRLASDALLQRTGNAVAVAWRRPRY